MSSFVTSVEYSSDYEQLATDIAAPMTSEVLETEQEANAQLKAFNFNQGVSSGVSKLSVDEEVILQLKKKTEEEAFNMITLHFIYKDSHICNRLRHWAHQLMGVPYRLYFNFFGEEALRPWDVY